MELIITTVSKGATCLDNFNFKYFSLFFLVLLAIGGLVLCYDIYFLLKKWCEYRKIQAMRWDFNFIIRAGIVT